MPVTIRKNNKQVRHSEGDTDDRIALRTVTSKNEDNLYPLPKHRGIRFIKILGKIAAFVSHGTQKSYGVKYVRPCTRFIPGSGFLPLGFKVSTG
jgi:hypothetical protein